METLALRLDAVSRRYGSRVALAPVSLCVGPGAVCLVTGANGAGKTTLLRIAAGVVRPSTGSRSASGTSLYLAAGDGARSRAPVSQAVSFAHDVGAGMAAPDALAHVGLSEVAGLPAGSLSSGLRMRLTLAVALAAQPALLCLDEPTAHLDDAGRRLVACVVRTLSDAGTAVMVATHDASFLADRADARLLLDCGRAEVLA